MNLPLRPLRFITNFIKLEASSGIILVILAIVALILENSPWHIYYTQWFHEPFTLQVFGWQLHLSGSFIINDILMVIFFLLVGLEIKREIYLGELNSPSKVGLPAIAAFGGMALPALIYILFNYGDVESLRGWAIPTATDIAFALGIVSLLGKRVPVALKYYLMALAIFDDLGAIIIIAIFYQKGLSWLPLLGIGVCLLVLLGLNRLRVSALWLYMLMGVALWVCFLKSGIHPTLAGVLLALTIPLHSKKRGKFKPTGSPLRTLEHALHPWVAYGVLPLFALANAGVSFAGLGMSQLFTGVPLGIILGLFVGKQIGVFGASWLAIRCGVASLPKGANWSSMYAVAIICGIGFTMSLFIGNLAFEEAGVGNPALVRFGVLVGSCLSGVFGYLLLRAAFNKNK